MLSELNIEFFISNSISIKRSEFIYKLGLFNSNSLIKFTGSKFKFLHTRFPVSFRDSKSYLPQFRLVTSLCLQFFGVKGRFYKEKFGLKNEQELFNFFEVFGSGFLDRFLIYIPKLMSEKYTLVGVLGKRFYFLRFLLLDMFNFLGFNTFKDFYLDYFNFDGFFAFDIYFKVQNLNSVFKFDGFPNMEFAFVQIFSKFLKIFLQVNIYIYIYIYIKVYKINFFCRR